MAAASRRQRRYQPRTVVSGRPSASAILRWPHPAASICRAQPITSTTSQRLGTTNQGSSACVVPHHAAHPRNPDQPIALRPEVTLIARPAAGRARAERARRSWHIHLPTALDVGIDIQRTEPYDRQRWTASPPPTLLESSPPGGSLASAPQYSLIAALADTIQRCHHRRDSVQIKAPSTTRPQVRLRLRQRRLGPG